MTTEMALTLFGEDDLVRPAGNADRFTTRWRLIGAGLSNVWRYGDLHLDAPSGRLLLRGPNGTGKTTALETLWPYLLDLNAQRLAAGKARPTSLALLMREGANGSKRRCGYVWLTLAAPQGEGVISYGVRLLYSESASPAVKVTPFTIPGVPLRDVPLYGPDRGFTSAEQFSDNIATAGGIVFTDEDAYVAHLASRLWATREREVVELANRIRAVRNPTLLGDVSPRAAADNLRDALPGVSDDIVSATADALAESESTRTAFEKDRRAAEALDRFAEAWSGHIVEIAGHALAALRHNISAHDKAVKDARAAVTKHAAAQTAWQDLDQQARNLRNEAKDLDSQLHALEESEPYKDAGRLADMQEKVAAQNRAADIAVRSFRREVSATADRATKLRTTAEDLAEDLATLSASARAVDADAMPGRSPLTWTTRPRPLLDIGDETADPGPQTTIDYDEQILDDTAENWKRLAGEYRRRGDAALLAIRDRVETTTAEAEAERCERVSRARRADADRDKTQLDLKAKAARTAAAHLLDDIDTWHDTNRALAPAVQAACREETSDATDAWYPPGTNELRDLEIAQVLTEAEQLAAAVTTAGRTAVSVLRHHSHLSAQEAKRLRARSKELRERARALRTGRLLPIPRPEWAGPAENGETFADALDWHPDITDPDVRARLENGLAASGLLGATLQADALHTPAWSVHATAQPAPASLADVLTVDPEHPHSHLAEQILRRIPLAATSTEGPAGLVIGRDGTYATGPLHGRPPGVDDPGQLRPAEYIGAKQRRQAALRHADALDADADTLDHDAGNHDTSASRAQHEAAQISGALHAYPSRVHAATAEAGRAAAASKAAESEETAKTAAEDAAAQRELARSLRLEWELRTRAQHLPIAVPALETLRDTAAGSAGTLENLTSQLTGRHRDRLRRLAQSAAEDTRATATLPAEHAAAATIADEARSLATLHRELVDAVGLDSNEALRKHSLAKTQRDHVGREIRRVDGLLQTADRERIQAEEKAGAATSRAAEATQPVNDACTGLRTLLAAPGVPDALLTDPAMADLPDDAHALADVAQKALHGRRTTSRKLLRERYDTCRADLAGLWTLDPDEPVDALDTYVLTHDSVAYTPPAAAAEGRYLRERAQAALSRAEESALQEFVIGRLPLAIGTAWVKIDDWIRDVNRKMQKAAASSGVGVRISKTLLKDLNAAELTVYRLACKESTRTAAQQTEVGDALQALIAAADGATMTERLTNAVDIRRWLDISYEIIRPDGQINRWTSKTGLSGGERRLVVLAPMLAAVAAYYDQLDTAGLRLTALDEVPAEVDERGREGLARYLADLDLDLICTSYLWDGAPGAWDGIDAWDLEAGPDTTVVAFPMLVRGPEPLPGDPMGA
ncbi:SbcC/MukB-like Walker B domain-containing protein [Catenuloplanes indicus]|uniref:TIGR02680 family protein n=1 Tax=Catenuloplanes indicus TaxID=137267 RepID=A0AAE3VY00_9ACTN|nr:SbcC/MukB-like Walker B domain-containing protein [Catenuloplanes indicus]MDQ0365065.1 hypothetical protein [Catenuloplanes indicus]